MKLPVIKKGKKFYNTLTKKFVSESYGKRLNNYFKKNPDSSLYRAGGHGKYKRKRALSEHSREIKRLAYGKGSQLIRTKSLKKKKPIYYSPFLDEILTERQTRILKKLDYYICNKKVYVELFRLTRERNNIYHILTWNVNQRLHNSNSVDFFMPTAMFTFNKITREIKKLVKNVNFSKVTILYGHISSYFYSDMDGWEKGTTFGFVLPTAEGLKIFQKEFIKLLDWYRDKLEIDAYHNVMIQKISFYLYDSVSNANEKSREIANYRIGINRLYH